ncbi:hypothetical protein QR680_010449 [Steinernema hermaphroditum]|uniref:Uncharacterized protein n=1 Tax=Steinernema hermaphroditum TaxID=289476 RepID=A0AA39IQV6_9BILA|nr:hypothetical protein QR680_010449 [Steinernema hermaphroditum]
MSVRGQIHHLDRPAPYTAIACTKENAILALTDLSIEAPVVVDIASTTNFVGPVPTLTKYPVLPGETFNLFTYVQRFVGADEPAFSTDIEKKNDDHPSIEQRLEEIFAPQRTPTRPATLKAPKKRPSSPPHSQENHEVPRDRPSPIRLPSKRPEAERKNPTYSHSRRPTYDSRPPRVVHRQSTRQEVQLVIGNLHHLKQANSWRTFLDATKDVPVLTSKYAELLDEGYIS